MSKTTYTLHQRFIKGLKEKHEMEPKDLNDWWYIGGSADVGSQNYFLLCNKKLNFTEPSTTECVCYQQIERLYYITNGEQILTIGSECKSQFCGEYAQGRTCEICRAPHKNRIINQCNECRKKNVEIKPKGRFCEICGALHRNRVVNQCNDCRKGVCLKCRKECIAKYKLCSTCKFGKPLYTGFCDTCEKPCKEPFTRCYTCKFGKPVYTGFCDTCEKPCKEPFTRCYTCKFKERLDDTE